MESSNSGSFQSSSGGAGDNDVDYDSRPPQSISSFFNPSTNFNPNLTHLLQPPPPPHHRPSFYTPSSPPSFPPDPIQHPTSTWTRTIRPDPINLPDFTINHPNPSTTTDNSQTKPARGSDHQIGVAVKNPKKRTRASRRAPTTVLTTDTTNFRQMVQEFTGIPTAPFANAPFSRRLDLFASAGSLRPSANKIQPQPPPFLNSAAANIIVESNNTSAATTTSGNYHFAPSTINNFQKQPSNFLDLQNPMFSFQSLLQNSSSLPHQSNDLQKRWGDQNGKLEGFEGVVGDSQNIGGSKLNSGMENNVLVSSRSGGEQVQGNEGSWICPSN